MIKTCQHCGAVNGDPSDLCCFCDAPLGGVGHLSVSRRAITSTEGGLAVEPEWRREVSSRLQDYRARRRSAVAAGAGLQAALPFESGSAHSFEAAEIEAEVAPPPARKPAGSRMRRQERFEIAVPKREASTGAVETPWSIDLGPAASVPHALPLPVASLYERRRAAIVDAGLLVFSYGGMLALFTVLGGHIGLNKTDLAVAGATFALFYAQYFALFTVFGGMTPGMMLRGLRVVSFEGAIPTSRQMAWRSFGYLISAGTCFLGFVWSLWDDDQLCWQDRMSQTYLTPTEEIKRI